MQCLNGIASEFDVAVVVTNQVASVTNEGQQPAKQGSML
jgi:hypothetical protein